MNHPDLFCGESAIVEKPALTFIREWERISNYRKAEGKEKCGNCKHICGFKQSKKWYKCLLWGTDGGPATDIKVNHVCDRWEKE